MNATGKRARKRYGNRFAAKSHKSSRGTRSTKRKFGSLPVSVLKGNTEAFIRGQA